MSDLVENVENIDGRVVELTTQLETLAAQLRSGELSSEEAAKLVEECARLAGEAGAELEQIVGAGSSISPQQGELL